MKRGNQNTNQTFSVLRVAALAPVLLLAACAGKTGGLDSGDSRVVWSNQPVMLAQSGLSTVNLVLTSTVLPPTVGTTTLTADDIFPGTLNTYVSYNIPGATHMGGIDQLTLSTSTLALRTASTTFATSTVNGVYQTGNNVYMVGSTNDTTTSGWPAYVSLLNIGLAGLTGFSAPVTTAPLLNTYAGTGVTMWKNLLYTISGANGASTSQGIKILNPTTLAQAQSPITIADARGMATYTGSSTTTTTDLFVIAGGGNLYDINATSATSGGSPITRTVAVGGNTSAESKSSIQVGKTMVAVSKGDQGAAIVCQADGAILATLPAQTVSGLTAAQTVTNGIAAGSGMLYVANGQAGVYVYAMTASNPTTSSCKNITLSYISTVNLGSTTYSANTVRYTNGVLYVASGLGGFKIISVSAIPAIANGSTDFD